MQLNTEQKRALDNFIDFLSSSDQIFILKGHAGTGKTTLIKEFINYLNNINQTPVLMASTGRAANVLNKKTLFSSNTVHRVIYRLIDISVDESKEIKFMEFGLQSSQDPQNTVYIVDESSMLSNKKQERFNLKYGSGMLIQDLITYIDNRKIIFVGDPCQLTPINTAYSHALSIDFFKTKLGKSCRESKLTQVVRYSSNSGIFANTSHLRTLIENNQALSNPVIFANKYSDIHVYNSEEQLINYYCSLATTKGIDQLCFIANSNNKVAEINRSIRRILWKKQTYKLNVGEPLLVMQNNYLYNLNNGDLVEVIKVSDEVETRAGLTFRDAVIQTFLNEGMVLINCKILDTLLNSTTVGLVDEQEGKLYIDFIVRMKGKNINVKSREFYDALLKDQYMNALRVKYGYAMTCHKAQGGEWKHIFAVFEPYMFTVLPKDQLHRWLYTALSRAEKQLHLANNYCIKR
ncbi:MAG: hypothetical protein AUJ98_01590 [Bacteroidetes bacterium CG2_30_33_31]|nr:MAG: hypothetical protein AUJ98_01590 [Bacteroidetes bacterium CG2_30_33_31]